MAKKTFIGRAFISITGDKKGLDAILSKVRGSMNDLGKQLQKWGYGMMAAGTAIQAPLTLAVQQFAKLGDEIAKGAKRSGLATEAYSELAHVAMLSGSSAERFEKSIQAMARGLFDAKRGTGEMGFALKQLGLSWKDFESLDSDGKFMLLADRIGRVQDPSIRAAIAMKAFGKAGAELVPLFDLGAGGIQHYREEAQRLGLSMGADMAKNAELLTDQWTRMAGALKGLTYAIGNQLAPIFDKMLTYATNLIVNVREYLQANPQIVQGAWRLATSLIAVGAALVGIGTGLRWLSVLVSPGGVLLALAGILLYVSGALDGIVAKWGKALMDFELGGKRVREWLTLVMESLGDIWTALKDAAYMVGRAMGPISGAVLHVLDSIWQQIKLSFLEAKAWVINQVYDVIATVRDTIAASKGWGARIFGEDALGALGAMQTALSRSRGAQVRGLNDQRAAVAGSRSAAATGMDDALRAVARLADNLFTRGGFLGKQLAGKWTEALGPALESIFGTGGGEAGGVNSFMDIFKNLGRQFEEWSKPSTTAMVAPGAALASVGAGGTFSGMGAASMAEGGMLRIARESLATLKDIRAGIDAMATGGVGEEE